MSQAFCSSSNATVLFLRDVSGVLLVFKYDAPIFHGCLKRFARLRLRRSSFCGMSQAICSFSNKAVQFLKGVSGVLLIFECDGPVFEGCLKRFARFRMRRYSF